MSARPLAWLMFAALALAACNGQPEDSAGTPADSRTGSLGILAVEREAQGSSAPAALGAAFARYQGVDGETVARLLGASEGVAPESCSLRTNDTDALVASDANVELLDVGTIAVRTGATETRLPPRAFPELARVAGGFFYADDAVLAPASTEGGEYVFRTEGSASVAPFEVVAPGPPDPADVRIDWLAPGDSTIARDRGADVTWTPSDARDDIEVELQTVSGTLACRAHDDGEFHVAPASLAQLSPDGDARLVVRRVRTTPFDAPGIDDALVRIAATRRFVIALR